MKEPTNPAHEPLHMIALDGGTPPKKPAVSNASARTCDNTSRALSQGTSRICSAIPSSRGDFHASVRWITMLLVLQMTNIPFTHLSNTLPAWRRSTLMRLCPFILVLHAAIVENASLPPLKKTPHMVGKPMSLRVIPCPDPSCEEAPRKLLSLSRISVSLLWPSCRCHNKAR